MEDDKKYMWGGSFLKIPFQMIFGLLIEMKI
jgi:hypothetical protein